MPPVTVLADQSELVPTSRFPYGKLPFQSFNPVQSRLFDFFDKETSAVIATPTASGKTISAELFLAHEIRKRGGKGLYLAPLRALAQEKYEDWTATNHHFNDLKVSICTGDYKLTAKRKEELEKADLIIMTSELLNHRARSQKSEKSKFLQNIGTLVVDECFPGNVVVRIEPNIDIEIRKIVESDAITHVMAYDGNYIVKKKILRKITRYSEKKLILIKHEQGSVLCTEDHKIWTVNGYKKACELNPAEDCIKYVPLSSSFQCPVCGETLTTRHSLVMHYFYWHKDGNNKDVERIENRAVVKIISVKQWGNRARQVYDLEIEDCHNYFANGILVSNCHMLTMPSRGDHLESGLMKFTEINPLVRLVMLSATMPNVDEIADWVSYVLTKRDTCLLVSKYRPCPLNLHYEKCWDGERNYEDNELEKVNLARQIVDYYPDDKFLIFAHTKRTGEFMKQSLLSAKISCEFHNADLDSKKRFSLEKDFKEGDLRVVVATSTLASGINLPARRVIVLGVHRGMAEVSALDLIQMCGRAGRPAFDPIGDAYVLLPESHFDVHKERLRKPQPIKSQMLDDIGGKHKVLAFHLISEINQGNVADKDDVRHWYKRTLAAWQSHELGETIVDGVIDLLKKCGAVWEEDGKLTATSIGKIASLFYYSPFDVSDLKRNFNNLFDFNRESDDYWVSLALGNLDTQRSGIVSRAEREEMGKYAAQINDLCGNGVIFEPAIKAGFAYYLLLNGQNNVHLAGFCRGLQFDFPRLNQVLMAIDGFTGKWGRKNWFQELQLRVAYGVKGPMAILCQIPNVGRVRANKLWAAGFQTIDDVAHNPGGVAACLGLKQQILDEIISGAKTLLLTQ